MAGISVITAHWGGTNPFIEQAYQSLRAQTFSDWEWIVVTNNGGELPGYIRKDERVEAINCTEEMTVGGYKRLACMNATSDYIAELDADDMLTPDCLEEVVKVFEENDDVCFVYSNSAHFKDQTWENEKYSEYWGWKWREFEYKGHTLYEMRGFEATPTSMRMIYWAPNHIRAWREKDYWAIGGHDVELNLGDDFDLCCRFYLHGEMRLIDKCLYLYRVHENNTCVVRNEDVQKSAWKSYSKYIYAMVKKWSNERGLTLLDLGSAHGKPEGFLGIDLHDSDIIADLRDGIPLPDNSVGMVRANDVLEHFADPVPVMNEIYRVLAPGGWLFLAVPSTDGRGAFQAPDHKSFWNQNSIWYYTNPKYAKYIPEIECKFQVSRVITWFPSDFHKSEDIPYVDAQLIAVKEGYEPIGECFWKYEE